MVCTHFVQFHIVHGITRPCDDFDLWVVMFEKVHQPINLIHIINRHDHRFGMFNASRVQQIVIGVVIVLAVMVDANKRKSR